MDDGVKQVLMTKRMQMGYKNADEILDDLGLGQKRTVHQVVAQDLARRFAPEAIMCLVDVMKNSTDPRARIVAAESLLSRGYGKPSETVKMVGMVNYTDETDPALMTTAQLKRMILDKLSEGAAVIDVTPTEPTDRPEPDQP